MGNSQVQLASDRVEVVSVVVVGVVVEGTAEGPVGVVGVALAVIVALVVTVAVIVAVGGVLLGMVQVVMEVQGGVRAMRGLSRMTRRLSRLWELSWGRCREEEKQIVTSQACPGSPIIEYHHGHEDFVRT